MAVLQIFSGNILPLLVFVAIGYVLDIRYRMDIQSITKLTFHIIIPCFIFYSIYKAEMDPALLHVFLFAVALMIVIGIIGTVWCRLLGMPSDKTQAFKNGTMFSNAGNIGVALIALVFANDPYVVNGETPYLAEAAAAATLVLVQMNMCLNTIGLYQAGMGMLTPRDALITVLKMPVLYTLTAAFLVKLSGFDMTTTFVWPILEACSGALVLIVMTALGMQIHRAKFSFGDKDAWIGCFFRLIGGPACAWLLIKCWALMGYPFTNVTAQTLFIMASVPAPVNSVLFAVEFHNCEDFATELVMMSTLLSCATMTGCIYAARILFPV